MVHILVIFLVTSLISFTGSLQMGPLNLATMQATLTHGSASGRMVALGGCIPEFIYAFLALIAASWLEQHAQVVIVLEWGIVPLLLGLGIMNLLKKTKPKNPDEEQKSKSGIHFFKGFIISLFNPQMLPFWLSILIMLNGYAFFHIESIAEKTAFVLGTGAGEYVLLSTIAALTHRYRDFFLRRLSKWNVNKVFGFLFIGLAVLQTGKLILR
ncbi:MAG: lysine exporter protein LysE/YggA [Bacteroidetes bacterium]|nr:MAG: lysine exporter protein LysE/YggA [Bacteroidota bacterium]